MQFRKFLIPLFLYCLIQSPSVAQNKVTDIRLGLHEDKTRLVIESINKPEYEILKTEPHIEILLQNVIVEKKFLKKTKGKERISSYFLEGSERNSYILHINTHAAQLSKIFIMNQPHRLII